MPGAIADGRARPAPERGEPPGVRHRPLEAFASLALGSGPRLLDAVRDVSGGLVELCQRAVLRGVIEARRHRPWQHPCHAVSSAPVCARSQPRRPCARSRCRERAACRAWGLVASATTAAIAAQSGAWRCFLASAFAPPLRRARRGPLGEDQHLARAPGAHAIDSPRVDRLSTSRLRASWSGAIAGDFIPDAAALISTFRVSWVSFAHGDNFRNRLTIEVLGFHSLPIPYRRPRRRGLYRSFRGTGVVGLVVKPRAYRFGHSPTVLQHPALLTTTTTRGETPWGPHDLIGPIVRVPRRKGHRRFP